MSDVAEQFLMYVGLAILIGVIMFGPREPRT